MPRLSPFAGLRYDDAVVGPLDRVTAPPYDVISDARREELLRASPFGVARIDLGRGPDGAGAGAGSDYDEAARLLREWRSSGVLVRSEVPACYVYEMLTAAPSTWLADPIVVRGVICAMGVEPWGGTVLPHERIMDGPVRDRLALLRATATHLSPIYGAIRDPLGRLDAVAAEIGRGHPTVETVDEEGTRHRMWAVPADAFDLTHLERERLLIADGHHRYTTAMRYREERDDADGPGPWDTVMTYVVDAQALHLPVLPFHRVQVSGHPPAIEGDEVADVAAALARLDDAEGTVAVVHRGHDGSPTMRVRRLDGALPTVRSLHDGPLAGVQRDALRFLPDPERAAAAVADGDAVAAYLLPPTTVARIMAVVERGDRLPEKSTYFWPKPRTGIVMMPVDGSDTGTGETLTGPAPPAS